MSNKYKILKVRDCKDNFYTNKGDYIDNLPFRTLITGRSHVCGKSNLALNLCLLDEYYNKDFEGDNIYIITDNPKDTKIQLLIRQKDIPESNIMNYDPELLDTLYEYLEEQYQEAIDEKEKPPNVLLYMDDIGYSGKLKSTSKASKSVNKIFCNSRHINVSVILILQSIMQVSSTCRKNASSAYLMCMATKQEIESMEKSFNHLPTSKAFINMYLDATREKHSFLLCCYSNSYNNLYLDSFFNPIDTNKYIKDNKKDKDTKKDKDIKNDKDTKKNKK